MKHTLILLFTLTSTLLIADTLHRAAKPNEKAAMEKALAAMTKVINSFTSENWVPSGEFHPTPDTVNAQPASPLDAALSYSRKYAIKEGSPLFKSKVLPAVEAIKKAYEAKDYAGATKAGEVTNGTMGFTVENHVNRLSVPSGAKMTNIPAKGATIALIDQSGSGYVVIVGVGDWTHAKFTPGTLTYKFKNGKGSGHVENIVFQFVTRKPTGFAADRILEIVRTTDWSELNKGLSP